MDGDSPSTSQHLSHSGLPDHINNDLAVDHYNMPAACSLCGRTLSSEADINSNLRAVSICGDCKFLLLEDYGTPSHESHQRRLSRRRRLTYASSESSEDLFSQQFTQIIHQARHIEVIEPEHEDLSRDIDHSASYHQPTSTQTTPSSSRRWRRIISDAESDGFNSDSLYGENESNISFGAYRVSSADSDAVSFSGYGGDSDASVDGHTFLDTDIFAQSLGRSDIDSDTDIDPMHAGAVQWNSDDHEDIDDDNEWEVEGEQNAVGPTEAEAYADTSGGIDLSISHRRAYSPEFEGIIRWRIREGRDFDIPSILTGMEESGGSPYLSNQGDYLDARGFEEFLEHLAENDSSRRGAPPAAASFVDSLPVIVISEDHQEPEGTACAICKDLLTIGTEVNQLPCLHLYHPSCILPWLSARNSCPLCRYELPTDDIDYELGKHDASRMIISQIQEQDDRDDGSSVTTDDSEIDDAQVVDVLRNVGPTADSSQNGGGRGRWLFLAAAPIVGLMGVVLVLWLGNSLTGGMHQTVEHNLHGQHPQHIHTSDSSPRNQRVRRWWFF